MLTIIVGIALFVFGLIFRFNTNDIPDRDIRAIYQCVMSPCFGVMGLAMICYGFALVF